MSGIKKLYYIFGVNKLFKKTKKIKLPKYIDNDNGNLFLKGKNGWYKKKFDLNEEILEFETVEIEEQIFLLLKNNNINFEYRKKDLPWLKDKEHLELDFYLPDYNIAIECQGIQHFVPIKYFGGEEKLNRQLKYDKIKKELCKEHNIEILYFCEKRYKFENVFNDIEILKEKLFLYGLKFK